MGKPRIFLGSSTKQAKLLDLVASGLEDVAEVEPWMASFNPGTVTLDRLVELTRQVDFAAFVFAQDDWTSVATSNAEAGQASPRDNVVFEAGLFGGVLGMRRTFILHAHGAKLPTDLLGLTCARYAAPTAAAMKGVIDQLRNAIESELKIVRIEGAWWQYSLTERSEREPSALSLLRISRANDGMLEVNGRSWRADGSLSARYWSEAAKAKHDPPGVFYYWKGERPLDPNAPELHGTGGIRAESADRASGYFTTLSDARPEVHARTSGIYVRASPEEAGIMDGPDDRRRSMLIAKRLKDWQTIRSA